MIKAVFSPKWILNSFPKSGTHLLVGMISAIAEPEREPGGPFAKEWTGTYRRCWTNEYVLLEKVTYKAGRVTDNHYLKAHMGYRDEIERFLWFLGAAHVFIYRDLRDVAVSQTYHILSEDTDRLFHADRDKYSQNFGEALSQVICGIDEYSGIIDRWRAYAGWLDVDWVLKIRFEDCIENRKREAKRILGYGLARTARIWNRTPKINEEIFELYAQTMVQASMETDRSPTFREGKVGGWREHFTNKHLCEFDKVGGNEWLKRLSY